MPISLPDIIYRNDKDSGLVVDSINSFYEVPFTKSREYFDNLTNWTRFVKGAEWNVRNDERYSKYISFLKKECKMDHCQVISGLNDADCTIEMHHGPIFTLFDICAIVTEYFLLHNWDITTFRIAKQVLKDHNDHMIQVVMVSKTVHQEIHAHNIFLNYHQAWGDMNRFVDKYNDALGREYRNKLNTYIDKCLLNDSTDYELLELSSKLYQ